MPSYDSKNEAAAGNSELGPRLLMKQLREIMAASSGQALLDRIVVLIAANMIAEVASIYLLRPDDVLELYATQGLNPKAVHKTFLPVGEGIIGDVAGHGRALNLPDAQSHRSFSYKAETGEEIYHSMLGVPIRRFGHVLGVLAVQNRVRRDYSEDEVEALETVAMVLAEVIAAGKYINLEALHEAEVSRSHMRYVKGLALADGMALGTVVLHEPVVEVKTMIADDLEAEQARLKQAIAAMRSSVDSMLAHEDIEVSGDTRDVLEAYRMFAHDKGWLKKITEAVATGLTAEAAVERVQIQTRVHMRKINDPYLRDRLHDLDDLAYRLLRHLTGSDPKTQAGKLPDDAIVIARAIGPAELFDYDRNKLKAIVLEEGSGNSHAAIIARALGLPMVGHIDGVTSIADAGDSIIVDGDNGTVCLRPGKELLTDYSKRIHARTRKVQEYAKLKDTPAITRDGQPVTLNLNAGLLQDVPHMIEVGADGIGLFRTELQFMLTPNLPKFDELVEFYRSILSEAGDYPVVFRTLDIGGDKVLPYVVTGEEENPALGWRATRIALDKEGLLIRQLKAMLMAADGAEKFRIMFPMITEVDELVRARRVLDRVVDWYRYIKPDVKLPGKILVGTMLEVPALAFQIAALKPHADFISVGSNDLTQFLFAADRNNHKTAGRYDLLSPPMLKLLRQIVLDCRAHNILLSLCGEMAGRTLEAMALIGIGFRTISMPPGSIGPAKAMVLSLDAQAAEAHLESLYSLPDHSVRPHLQAFAKAQGIVV